MSEVDVIDVGRNALWVVIKVAGPIMFLGLISGLIIALFQALTTIQEMTLTFVPKILVIFTALLVLLPWMMTELIEFMGRMVDHFIGLPN